MHWKYGREGLVKVLLSYQKMRTELDGIGNLCPNEGRAYHGEAEFFNPIVLNIINLIVGSITIPVLFLMCRSDPLSKGISQIVSQRCKTYKKLLSHTLICRYLLFHLEIKLGTRFAVNRDWPNACGVDLTPNYCDNIKKEQNLEIYPSYYKSPVQTGLHVYT